MQAPTRPIETHLPKRMISFFVKASEEERKNKKEKKGNVETE